MKYGKIRNGRVVDVVQGLQPEGYVEISIDWSWPTEYPKEFYSGTSTKPILTVTDNTISETFELVLKPVDEVKSYIQDEQETMRYGKQLGSFVVDGDTITLKDRDDARDIANLSTSTGNYKRAKGKWIKTAKIAQLKTAASNYVQAAFDWEMEQNELVDDMTTMDELKTYFDAL